MSDTIQAPQINPDVVDQAVNDQVAQDVVAQAEKRQPSTNIDPSILAGMALEGFGVGVPIYVTREADKDALSNSAPNGAQVVDGTKTAEELAQEWHDRLQARLDITFPDRADRKQAAQKGHTIGADATPTETTQG